jgi:excisionase family DNA binding protein
MADSEEILTLKEVAIILRCSKAHVANVIAGRVKGLPDMPVIRMGRRVLVRRSALMEWLQVAENAGEKCSGDRWYYSGGSVFSANDAQKEKRAKKATSTR